MIYLLWKDKNSFKSSCGANMPKQISERTLQGNSQPKIWAKANYSTPYVIRCGKAQACFGSGTEYPLNALTFG